MHTLLSDEPVSTERIPERVLHIRQMLRRSSVSALALMEEVGALSLHLREGQQSTVEPHCEGSLDDALEVARSIEQLASAIGADLARIKAAKGEEASA